MAVIALNLLVAFVLPLIFVVWMTGPWVASRLDGLILALMTGCFIAFLFVAGVAWSWVGLWARWVPVAMFAIGLVVLLARWRGRPWVAHRGWGRKASFVAKALVAALFAVQLWQGVSGFRPGAGTIDIAMPLEPGAYVVLNGGSTAALNGHHGVRAQAYALDILAQDDGDRRASGLRPERVEDYAIYGRLIVAPCDGTVIGTSDGMSDTPIGGGNDETPAGNHVLLTCTVQDRRVTVLLAHIAPGTVAVSPGQSVSIGMTLGKVGSSGNSSEPHLHIHAVEGEVRDMAVVITTADPVPLTIRGDFLVRNETFGSGP